MRIAEKTLETLGNISKQHLDYVFRRVYRELFNRDLLLRAYLKLAPNEGNMTRGTDGRTIDGFSMEMVDEIIDQLRPHIRDISTRTYYRKRKEAVEVLSSVLWGYTAQDSAGIVREFLQ